MEKKKCKILFISVVAELIPSNFKDKNFFIMFVRKCSALMLFQTNYQNSVHVPNATHLVQDCSPELQRTGFCT